MNTEQVIIGLLVLLVGLVIRMNFMMGQGQEKFTSHNTRITRIENWVGINKQEQS